MGLGVCLGVSIALGLIINLLRSLPRRPLHGFFMDLFLRFGFDILASLSGRSLRDPYGVYLPLEFVIRPPGSPPRPE